MVVVVAVAEGAPLITHKRAYKIFQASILMLLISFIWPLNQCLAISALADTTAAQKKPPKKTSHVYKKPFNTKLLLKYENVKKFPQLLSSGIINIEDIPDPHWKKNACIACHKTGNKNASENNLQHSSVETVCNNCHSAKYDHRYIHPENIKPDKQMMQRMAPSMKIILKKTRNKIDCNTCHELRIQCLPDIKKQKLTNPKFFRAGPYNTRSQLCFLCHDEQAYQRLNPHEQIDEKGKIKAEKCRICHADSLSKLNKINDISQLKFNTDEPLKSMCWGCHPWIPHPGGQFSFFSQKSGPDHLTTPSKLVTDRLNKMTKKHNISFPLEPLSGKVFCGTCHNAHEKGVIKNAAGAKGADSKRRLRDQNICQYCHFK